MILESFYAMDEMIPELKRLLTEWKKIFAIYTYDQGLITIIYMELK
jgi:hypothetical protein